MQDRLPTRSTNLLQRTAGPYIRVKLGSGGGCQSGLFYPQQQTFAAQANTSVWCQEATKDFGFEMKEAAN